MVKTKDRWSGVQRINGVGVVGFGYWGPNLVRNFLKTGGVELVAVCDASEKRRDAACSSYPQVQVVEEYTSLLRNPAIGAIAIATPARSHYVLAKQAILAGKHVLVEKPMTMLVSHAEELIAMAKARNVVLMVDHTFTFEPAVSELYQAIQAGAIGSPTSILATRGNNGPFHQDVNVIWDLAPHDLSIISFLIERCPIVVSAKAEGHVAAKEAQATLLLRYSDLFTAEIRCSWLLEAKTRFMTIYGSKGSLTYDDVSQGNKIAFHSRFPNANAHRASAFEGQAQDVKRRDQRQITFPCEPLAAMTTEFVRCIGQRKRPRSDGAAGLRVVKVLAALQRSLDLQGCAVPV